MPWAAQQMYLDFAESRQPVETLWPAEVFQRLRQITASVDPEDLIRSNHPVPPAR